MILAHRHVNNNINRVITESPSSEHFSDADMNSHINININNRVITESPTSEEEEEFPHAVSQNINRVITASPTSEDDFPPVDAKNVNRIITESPTSEQDFPHVDARNINRVITESPTSEETFEYMDDRKINRVITESPTSEEDIPQVDTKKIHRVITESPTSEESYVENNSRHVNRIITESPTSDDNEVRERVFVDSPVSESPSRLVDIQFKDPVQNYNRNYGNDFQPSFLLSSLNTEQQPVSASTSGPFSAITSSTATKSSSPFTAFYTPVENPSDMKSHMLSSTLMSTDSRALLQGLPLSLDALSIQSIHLHHRQVYDSPPSLVPIADITNSNLVMSPAITAAAASSSTGVNLSTSSLTSLPPPFLNLRTGSASSSNDSDTSLNQPRRSVESNSSPVYTYTHSHNQYNQNSQSKSQTGISQVIKKLGQSLKNSASPANSFKFFSGMSKEQRERERKERLERDRVPLPPSNLSFEQLVALSSQSSLASSSSSPAPLQQTTHGITSPTSHISDPIKQQSSSSLRTSSTSLPSPQNSHLINSSTSVTSQLQSHSPTSELIPQFKRQLVHSKKTSHFKSETDFFASISILQPLFVSQHRSIPLEILFTSHSLHLFQLPPSVSLSQILQAAQWCIEGCLMFARTELEKSQIKYDGLYVLIHIARAEGVESLDTDYRHVVADAQYYLGKAYAEDKSCKLTLFIFSFIRWD
jgi:hypothetical protein